MPGFRWGVTGLEQTTQRPHWAKQVAEIKRKFLNTEGVRNNMGKTQKAAKTKKLKSKLHQNSLAGGLPTKCLMLNTQQSQSSSFSNENKLESNVFSFIVLKTKSSMTASIFLVVKNLLDCWSDLLNLQESITISVTETNEFLLLVMKSSPVICEKSCCSVMKLNWVKITACLQDSFPEVEV